MAFSVDDILKSCTYSDNVLRLPDIRLDPKEFAEVKKTIVRAGGKWKGGGTQGFVFDFDADRIAGMLMNGEKTDIRRDYQFFETPASLADWLVGLSPAAIDGNSVVLEPSAGRGSIIGAVHRLVPGINVDCFEILPENRSFLEKMDNVTVCGDDFLEGVPRLYSHIFANPPFSKNQDIKHVYAMYDALDRNDGSLCVITSTHWRHSKDRACVGFRDWLNDVGATVKEIPAGAFSGSGTDVATVAIVIRRTD